MIDLDELERLYAASSDGGEWQAGRGIDGACIYDSEGSVFAIDKVGFPENAAFIVAAHNALPALLRELRAARVVVKAAQAYRWAKDQHYLVSTYGSKHGDEAVVAMAASNAWVDTERALVEFYERAKGGAR